ncbi:YjjG family noncanonical pyrimidine nucleotidase [Jeotgalibaca caeni]|uniref:YjjG family noncanonical pyrimidine nucleotidase n=1 Tax=Jeotgalibaca caeni TaxID=3028623 RepID=UPI00237DD3CF|nr:YjjG family noncanonical pyrimidine nucleotidase [Jeotgalibaca caeni]MDE1548618.1 YjjG family noncanonical pyrimidine nucleotidase [Jeotgalibaca caeni]
MNYKTLLFDIDDTLLDFKAAETHAISHLLEEMGIAITEERIAQYAAINQVLWEQFEKGLIQREVLLGKRFEDFFALYGKKVDGQEMDRTFRARLEEGNYLMEGSLELLESLKQTHDLYAVTNGVSKTQQRRMADSGLRPYFKKVFVSEDTGYQKPMPEYFDYVFARIASFQKEETLIIGDSLTSDITGGVLAGIDSCWFNPLKKPNPLSIQPTYEIEQLADLPALLFQA